MMFALVTSEELESLGQIMVKQLKNRYNDPTLNKRFAIGVDRSKMRLYDIDVNAQKNIADSGQEIDHQPKQRDSKSKFDGLKI